MGIARSTYDGAAPSPADDAAIVEAIAAICEQFECYGWRRARAALRQQGMFVNHKKIKRLMREHGLQPRIRRRYVMPTRRLTSSSAYRPSAAKNDQAQTKEHPQVWACGPLKLCG